MRQSFTFHNQLVYEEILSWLGFAFASDGREGGEVRTPTGYIPQTPNDLYLDAVYGLLQADNLISRCGIAQ